MLIAKNELFPIEENKNNTKSTNKHESKRKQDLW